MNKCITSCQAETEVDITLISVGRRFVCYGDDRSVIGYIPSKGLLVLIHAPGWLSGVATYYL